MQVTIIPKFPDDCEQWYNWVDELRDYQGKTGELIDKRRDYVDIVFPDGKAWAFHRDWVLKPYTPGVWYPWDPEEAKKHTRLLIYGSVRAGPKEVIDGYLRPTGDWVKETTGEPVSDFIQFLIIPKVSE